MHAIQANTKYAIVTLQLAIPTDRTGDDDEITDGLNYLFNDLLDEAEENNDPAFIADWRFISPDEPLPKIVSSADPKEGELFHNSTIK